MKHIVSFSGGKDSTALLLWAKENLVEFDVVFFDTGWEHPLTYAYIDKIDRQVLNGSLKVLSSRTYSGFEDLALSKGRFPGRNSRFCTEELKIKPLHTYIESIEDDVTTYTGIRAEESSARARMKPAEFIPEAGGYWTMRPLFDWTAEQCFALMRQHGVEPNPLYLMGAGRVGCWPCIMVSHRELKSLLMTTPDIKERVLSLEAKVNAGTAEKHPHRVGQDFTFFPVGYIPERFCTGHWIAKDGRVLKLPKAQDVFSYLEAKNLDELQAYDAPRCMSVYNLCE